MLKKLQEKRGAIEKTAFLTVIAQRTIYYILQKRAGAIYSENGLYNYLRCVLENRLFYVRLCNDNFKVKETIS